MMIDQIKLADIRTFVLVTQKGNFTLAAEALNVSRSHVSRQISNLEQTMGVTLLIRTTRSLRLTDAGKTLYAQCERALFDIETALFAAVDNVEAIQGEIRINSVGGYLGEEIIAEIAAQFMLAYPEVSVHLDFSSHRVDLIHDDFDVAFRMGPIEDTGFIARKLMDIHMTTLASPAYLQRNGRPLHPSELVRHQCLTGSVKQWRFQHKFNAAVVEVNIAGQLQCKNGRVLVKGALNGNGIIRVPYIYCAVQVKQGLLEEVFTDWQIPSADFSMIYHQDKFQPKRVRAFVAFVREYFLSNSLG